ncbi:MAG: hypothetical protein NTX52_04780, partial [Planctomycetota bacterium]|nr:hypothetical protein [Planctomycetota bacterium]
MAKIASQLLQHQNAEQCCYLRSAWLMVVDCKGNRWRSLAIYGLRQQSVYMRLALLALEPVLSTFSPSLSHKTTIIVLLGGLSPDLFIAITHSSSSLPLWLNFLSCPLNAVRYPLFSVCCSGDLPFNLLISYLCY